MALSNLFQLLDVQDPGFSHAYLCWNDGDEHRLHLVLLIASMSIDLALRALCERHA